jgi:hypothetical protein
VAEHIEPEDSHAVTTRSSKVERSEEVTAYLTFFEKALVFIWKTIVSFFTKLF